MNSRSTFFLCALSLALAVPRSWAQDAAALPEVRPTVLELPAGMDCAGGARTVAPFTPTMFGDLLGLTSDQFIAFSRQADGIASARGAYKIAENESPRPQDRIFGGYNFYANVQGNIDDIHRFVIGLEKVLPGGAFSIGVRAPFFNVLRENEVPAFADPVAGDICFVFKWAPINEPDRVLSGGLVLTTPSAPEPSFILPFGEEVHSTLLQPFVGYFRDWNGLYLQGFTSLMVPTDALDVTVLFNDVGVGYRMVRAEAAIIRAVVPTLELHVNTPLNHRGDDDLSRFRDQVNITGGAHFVFRRAALGLALGTPVSGPRAYDIETIVNFNWRF